jgi:hypothetical protein
VKRRIVLRLRWGGALALALAASCAREEPLLPGQIAKLHRVAEGVGSDMQRIAEQTVRLAAVTTEAYAHAGAILAAVNTNQYRMTDYGGYYKAVKDGRAALWVSGAVPVDDEVRRVAWLTEGIDNELKRIVGEFPEVVQAYFNDRHSVNRIYPPFDVLAQYEPAMDITSFSFYFLADERRNPDRGPVWVDAPYVDPAGRGWIISSIAPVYVSNRLEGVVGLDVTVQEIVERCVLPAHRNVMLVDRRGIVVAADRYLIDLLELPPLKEHRYMETIKSDQFLPEDYNLLKAKTKWVRQMAVQVLQQGLQEVRVMTCDHRYLVLARPVAPLGWTVLMIESLE